MLVQFIVSDKLMTVEVGPNLSVLQIAAYRQGFELLMLINKRSIHWRSNVISHSDGLTSSLA